MAQRVTFSAKFLPYALLAPQLAVTAVFFFYPAVKALYQATFVADPFGLKSVFVGGGNFRFLFTDPYYLASFQTTLIFAASVTFLSMALALYLATLADRLIHGYGAYRSVLIWPYAIAPAVAGVIWMFMFRPNVGVVSWYFSVAGYDWNYVLNPGEAMTLVVAVSAWKQVSYNFLFFLAGLQAIPKSLLEAAAMDGAHFWRRFATIVFPLLSPTTFFLLVVNVIYAFFDTFGVIHTITSGGPQQATTTLVYKVYADGFVGQDIGSSAAQSVVLLAVVGVLTMVQFRYIEKRVHY